MRCCFDVRVSCDSPFARRSRSLLHEAAGPICPAKRRPLQSSVARARRRAAGCSAVGAAIVVARASFSAPRRCCQAQMQLRGAAHMMAPRRQRQRQSRGVARPACASTPFAAAPRVCKPPPCPRCAHAARPATAQHPLPRRPRRRRTPPPRAAPAAPLRPQLRRQSRGGWSAAHRTAGVSCSSAKAQHAACVRTFLGTDFRLHELHAQRRCSHVG
jgi:hypothetical protein